MPGFLLDTNVVSEVRRARPHQGVVSWLSSVPDDQLFVSAVTLGEIQVGAEATRRHDAAKAREIEDFLERIVATFKVVAMDGDMFREWARLMFRRSRVDLEDAMIAAAARVLDLTVATRNVSDFRSFKVGLYNPFEYKG